MAKDLLTTGYAAIGPQAGRRLGAEARTRIGRSQRGEHTTHPAESRLSL